MVKQEKELKGRNTSEEEKVKPDSKKIIKECQWAISRIEDNGYTTMTSRKFFRDVIELLDDREKQVHQKYDDEDVVG